MDGILYLGEQASDIYVMTRYQKSTVLNALQTIQLPTIIYGSTM